MKTAFETEDIQEIVKALVDNLEPLLSGKNQKPLDDSILDVPALCEYLRVTPKWIHERTHLKEMPYYKLSNKQLRFRKKDIDRWLESLKTPALNHFRGKLKVIA